MKLVLTIILTLFSLQGFAQTTNQWSYHAPNGPAQWGALSGYSLCQVGADQSPVAIETGMEADIRNVTYDSSLMEVVNHWQPSSFSLIHNGHTIQVGYDSGSTVEFKEEAFDLKQFHFHSPSEHSLDFKQYPLEAHFVHSRGNELLVIGVFFKEGQAHPLLEKIWANSPTEEISSPKQIPNSVIDARDFLPASADYFHYMGSLTTPPCSEQVKWIVMKEPVEASRSQLGFLQKLLGGPNNRPLQPLDGRMIGETQNL